METINDILNQYFYSDVTGIIIDKYIGKRWLVIIQMVDLSTYELERYMRGDYYKQFYVIGAKYDDKIHHIKTDELGISEPYDSSLL